MKYVISLGGSIIVPNEIDIQLIKKFIRLINSLTKPRNQFFVVTGGGATARKYIAAAQSLSRSAQNADLDWLGIAATKLNAQLLNLGFTKSARRGIITDPSIYQRNLASVNLFSGWKPGWSTDYVAVKIAQTYGVKTVINLTNVDYVYSSDPRSNQSARKYVTLTWKDFRKLFSRKWKPGANLPFDPKGADLAAHLGIRVIVINGKNFSNLRNFFSQKKFFGTIIGN